MKKAAVARLSWDGSGPATLRALLPARILARWRSSGRRQVAGFR